MDLKDFANDIGSAEASDFGNRFEKGVYLLWLDSIKALRSKKDEARLVIPEFHVLQSTSPDLLVGLTVSEVFNLDGKAKKVHPGKVRQLLAALCGDEDYKKVGPVQVENALDQEKQPLYGRLVRAEAVEADEKDPKTGEPYIRVKYTPVPEEEQARAHELHVAAGFPPI